MARPTDLPIYQPAYELLQLLAKLTRQFSRDYRQVMGRGIFAEAHRRGLKLDHDLTKAIIRRGNHG